MVAVTGHAREPAGTVLAILLLLAFQALTPRPAAAAGESCLACHADRASGFAPGHASFAAAACTSCHAGDARAGDRDAAHAGLVARPGELGDADRTCGACHPAEVAGVAASPMHTGHGVVGTTRRVLGASGRAIPAGHSAWASLGHGPVDSMLRKLCASCHLGHARGSSPLGRGGGCLACHGGRSDGNGEGRSGAPGHAGLGRAVSDARCFGCHARSGRIALGYAGLAEVEPREAARAAGPLARLPDGRLVERRQADAHHRAGLACIDCHTASTLMGTGGVPGVDIACTDCHRAPGAAGPLVTGRRATPLAHLERADGALHLRRKLDGKTLPVPDYRTEDHPLEHEHARLSCEACHAAWAPRCTGCHVEYDPSGRQWDHQAGRVTPGRWRERRWGIGAGEPTLGVDAGGRIRPFVPGMVLTFEHPDLAAPRFVRRFAAVSPHTTGPARGCRSCHRSPLALGLGRGRLERTPDGPVFTPAGAPREDGLAEDAWTTLDADAPPPGGPRPLSAREIRRILDAPLGAR